MTKLMENIDQGIGEIEDSYRAAGLLDRTDFVITADHGMVNSRPARTTDVVRQTAARVHAGITVLDTAAGGISLVDSGKAKAVAEQLVALRPPHVAAIFYRSRPGLHYSYVLASPQRWLLNGAVRRALQHLVDTTAGLDGPDIWMLHREGYTAHYQNLAGIWKGTHGGATWEVQHVPLILAGPGIRSGAISQFPARAIDIAPTLERLLGLPPIKRDGVVLADALMDPTGKEIAAQNAVAGGLSADVEALQAESRADR
jgi:arylsulfatase A-like enzyme